MRKILINFLFACLCACEIMSCSNDEQVVSPKKLSPYKYEEKECDSNCEIIEKDLPTFISSENERKNPYSVANMKEAFVTIKKACECPQEFNSNLKIGGIANIIEIKATDYYVRILPQTSCSYAAWLDTCLISTFPHSLLLEDYDGMFDRNFYTLEDTKDEVPVLYGVCSFDSLPLLESSGVKFEIIDELFLPENSPDLKNYGNWYKNSKLLDLLEADELTITERDFAKALTHVAFANAEYETKDIGVLEETECEEKHFLWWKWTDCDTYRHPSGKINVDTIGGTRGVSGIKIKLFRWFTTHEVYTDGAGNYYDDDKWEVLPITDDICYTIVCEGRRDKKNLNFWNLKVGIIQGAVTLWTYSHILGFKSSTGYSATILNSSGKLWGRCLLNNAVYDYCMFCEHENLSYPPAHLDIASSDAASNGWVASTPLFKNHINCSLLQIPFFGLFLEIFAAELAYVAYPLLPDMLLKYSTDYDKERRDLIANFAWHELTHSSHFMRTKKDNDIFVASWYWSNVVAYEADHSINDTIYGTYGKIGDSGWEQIALAEGWANYRAWYLSKLYLSSPSVLKEKTYFGKNYVQYIYSDKFLKLHNNGISMEQIEKALSNTYTFEDFKSKLLNICPSNTNIINSIL